MTVDPCAEMQLLIQAELDGELDAAGAAAQARHLATCPECAAVRQELGGLSARLRAELPRHAAPPALRAAVLRQIPQPRAFWRSRRTVLEAVLAAGLVIAVLLPRGQPARLGDELVAAHIRALQPGHLTDVVSTDQHTVKPWFDGRLDYAPPVKDFAAQGFPLIGGRLDYADGRPVAVLVYRRDKHLIDVFVWPGQGAAETTQRQGYAVVGWSQGDMRFRAVSDVEISQLNAFSRLWQTD